MIYIYTLIVSAHFVAALETEHAATHLIILAAQIALTFAVLGFIWQWFYQRRIKALQRWSKEKRAEFADYMKRGQINQS